MSQNTLIEKIKADAADSVADIKATGQKEVEAIQRETSEAIATLRKEHEALEKKELDQMELVAVAKAKQAGKIALQEAKRREIDALFAELTKELSEQPSSEYVDFFVRHSSGIIPADVTVSGVQAPAGRVSETEEIMKKQGRSVAVTADNSLTAGFVLHTEDGVYDVTLERIINEKRPQIEMEVVQNVMK